MNFIYKVCSKYKTCTKIYRVSNCIHIGFYEKDIEFKCIQLEESNKKILFIVVPKISYFMVKQYLENKIKRLRGKKIILDKKLKI